MSNEILVHHAIQLVFQHHGLQLGDAVAFDKWLANGQHSKGWQEIVFTVQGFEPHINFDGVEVYWGSAEQKAVLFGSDCKGIQTQIGKPDFWTLLLPFCETVLSLSHHAQFAPLIRVDWQVPNQQHPSTFFFELNNFDYSTLRWTTLVPSLATPLAIGA